MKSSHQQFFEDTDALVTVGDLVRWGTSQLNRAEVFFGHGTDNSADEARVLVFHALALDFEVPDYFYASHVTPAERQKALDLIVKRIEQRKPAAYLTGEAWFAGLQFHVDERVLVPRSPFAELIAAQFHPWWPGTDQGSEPRRILDLCTGSGCIGIACAYAFANAEVDLSDIDAGALEVARSNVELHGMEARVRVKQSDLFEKLGDQQYDLIVCNPPYVPDSSMHRLPAEYHQEPRLGLHADNNGLAIVERILSDARNFLTPNGVLIVEVGESMASVNQQYSDLPLSWCDLELGGEGIFVIHAADLPG